MRGSSHDTPTSSPVSPIRTNAGTNEAVVETTGMSAANASPKREPAGGQLTAAITGQAELVKLI